MSKFKVGDEIVRTADSCVDQQPPHGYRATVIRVSPDGGFATIRYKCNDYIISDINWELAKDDDKFVVDKLYSGKITNKIYKCLWADEFIAVLRQEDNGRPSESMPHSFLKSYFKEYIPPVSKEVVVVLSKDGTVTTYSDEYIKANERSSRFVNAIARKKFTITEGQFDV